MFACLLSVVGTGDVLTSVKICLATGWMSIPQVHLITTGTLTSIPSGSSSSCERLSSNFSSGVAVRV